MINCYDIPFWVKYQFFLKSYIGIIQQADKIILCNQGNIISQDQTLRSVSGFLLTSWNKIAYLSKITYKRDIEHSFVDKKDIKCSLFDRFFIKDLLPLTSMFGFKGGKWMHHSQTHGHGHSHGHDKSQSPKKPNVILTPVPGTAYKIVSAMNDSMALTLKQGKSHTIVIDTFQSQDSQKFFFAIEHGKYTITSALENRHLHVDEDSHQNGANIHGAHKPHKSFVFQILPITTGPMAGKGIGFKTVSGKAFDIKGGQANSGTEVCQWDFHGGNNQIWILVPVAISYNTKASLPAEFVANPDQTYKIISVMDWKLSLTVKNQGNHTLSLETFTNDPTQQFHIYQENKKSAFVVVSTNNALCIFKDNKQNNGEIRTDAGNYPSSWFDVVPVTTGEWAHRAYILRTFAGKVADIHGGVANIGNRVCQWQGHGGNCQSWLIVPAEQAIV